MWRVVVVEEEDAEVERQQDGQVYIPGQRGISRVLRETIREIGIRGESVQRSYDCPGCFARGIREGRHKG